jgi:hypothetical protein
MFFASGKDNFGRLPVLTEGVFDISEFTTLEGEPLSLLGNITVLGFYGSQPNSHQGNAFNLTHKIYKKNRGFNDFQFVFLMPYGSEAEALKLKNELSEIVNTEQWKFGFGPPTAIVRVYNSLQTGYPLNKDMSTPYVFIIDKNANLRGRDDDEDVGTLYGFDASDYAEINNKMSDDIKVILAEYRLALKKYKAKREI